MEICVKGKTAVVGMSGGVDSSVAALLLKQQGYSVTGLFMLNWEESGENGVCPAEQDFQDVKRVCAALDIPYYSVNFSKQYYDNVFAHFLSELKAGRTPNPDVLCNREIKFGPLRDYAKSMGADVIATGHYCGVEHIGGRHNLLKAADCNKDQTYFLNQVREQQLEGVLFPLAELKKSEVRAIAEKYGLATAEKKDSTGICFIGERNFRNFLKNYLPAMPGDIVTAEGKVVGKHEGLMYYTLGQRKGLGLGGESGGEGRWLVIDKDLSHNRLVVSHGDESALFSCACLAEELNFIGFEPPAGEFECTAKFRYRQPEQRVRVCVEKGIMRIEFAQKQRAVTPGQYAVLYDERRCLGGGVITSVYY